MTEWAARRFWTSAEAREVDGGFEVFLDDRPVRTPHKSPLILPTEGLAQLVAEEWDAQVETIDPTTMPATRTANSAIEMVAPQMQAVADHLADYGGSDLLCYRAEGPETLRARQASEWDRWLEWAETTYDAALVPTSGLMPVAQSDEAIDRLRSPMGKMSAFELAAFYDLVTLPGSLVLGLAAAAKAASAEEIWAVSRVDELWQIEVWGKDEEAEAENQKKFDAFDLALKFYYLADSQTD